MERPRPQAPVQDTLKPVPLQELRLAPEGRRWHVDQPLGELDSLTPVRGELQARHGGNVLEVSGEAATIVTLCCDRCLQTFNHPLSFRCRELIWLGDPQPIEELMRHGGAEGLSADGSSAEASCESLDPRGRFDPAHWLFEQLSLQLPLQNRCGPDCPGPPTWNSGAPADSTVPAPPDPRWDQLRQLR